MASGEPSRPVKKVVGYPPLSELGDLQRREFHEALLDADAFEDLPGKWQAAVLEAEQRRYARMAALRQALEAACRWGYMGSNPANQAGRNRQPAPRSMRAFTNAELGRYRPSSRQPTVRSRCSRGNVATGLRPEPAIEAAGVTTPARIYNLRSTFASNALAAGVSVFELARIMGTSAHMIERSYGVQIEGAGAGIASRLDAFDAVQAEVSKAEGGV